jgi:hypothetical protein
MDELLPDIPHHGGEGQYLSVLRHSRGFGHTLENK